MRGSERERAGLDLLSKYLSLRAHSEQITELALLQWEDLRQSQAQPTFFYILQHWKVLVVRGRSNVYCLHTYVFNIHLDNVIYIWIVVQDQYCGISNVRNSESSDCFLPWTHPSPPMNEWLEALTQWESVSLRVSSSQLTESSTTELTEKWMDCFRKWFSSFKKRSVLLNKALTNDGTSCYLTLHTLSNKHT